MQTERLIASPTTSDTRSRPMTDEYLQPLMIMIVAMGCYFMIVPV